MRTSPPVRRPIAALAAMLATCLAVLAPDLSRAEPQTPGMAGRADPQKAAEPAKSPAKLPVAMDLSVTGDQTSARLTFTLSTPLEPKLAILEKPDRLVLDLP
jgi:hypothetical protein